MVVRLLSFNLNPSGARRRRIGLAGKAPAAAPKGDLRRGGAVQAHGRRHPGEQEGRSVCMIDSDSLVAGRNMQRNWCPVGDTRFAPVTLSTR